MWKKIVGAIAGCLLLLRWSRRFFLAWRMAGGAGTHFAISGGTLAMYLGASIVLLVSFWKTEGRWAKLTGIAFVALQVASIEVVASTA